MKRTIVCMAAVISIAAAIYAQSPRQENQVVNLRNLDQYVRITDHPHLMEDVTATLCAAPSFRLDDPHQPAYPDKVYCHVYVSPDAKDTILTAKGTYPVGSIIIKSKLAKQDSTQAILYTIMTKMPDGYDSDRGNWRYSIQDGKTFRELASGRIDSCISCHDHYKATDYITRTYLPESKGGPLPSNVESKRRSRPK